MAKQHRKALKRTWAQAMNDMDKAAQEMLILKDLFEETHPDYALLCEYNLTGLYMCIQGWNAFAKHAWGTLPKDVHDWMA